MRGEGDGESDGGVEEWALNEVMSEEGNEREMFWRTR